ncbi:MAG: VIT domain-containing protein [Burkholderiales bacterium]
MCAEAFFDPMPTAWHVLLVLSVPASNFWIWRQLRHGAPTQLRWAAFANGTAVAVATFYSLLFLPLVPIALVAIIAMGFGLLPLAPLASLISAVLLRHAFVKTHGGVAFRRYFLSGIAAGLVVLMGLDVPAAATRLGVQWAATGNSAQRERGLALVRSLGSEEILARLCYDSSGQPDGLLTWLVVFGGAILPNQNARQLQPPAAAAREVYYRAYGVPFNARPAPFTKGTWSRFDDFTFDNDHGGAQVGGRIKGLDLVASRLDGSVNGDEAVAYIEWTLEFRNTSAVDRETRLQIALPPGGVVSRATLWVNGEEREAAYGGRQAVRAAYERVAVQERKDPLLVTTKGADRVLAQAFPVPANGGTIKFKLGITAPLMMESSANASFVLPAIVDRNFSFAPDLRHALWIESAKKVSSLLPGLNMTRVKDELYRAEGSLGDSELTHARLPILVERDPHASSSLSGAVKGESILQEIAPGRAKVPGALLLVIDGSAPMRDAAANLIESLDKIPQGVRVGVLIASEPLRQIALAPWSASHKQSVIALISAASFTGGQDNSPALVQALKRLEAESNAMLLWVHGPQPMRFHDSAGAFDQAQTRLVRLPQVWLYNTEAGPNELLPDSPWSWSARSLPHSGNVQADLASFFERELGAQESFSIRRSPANSKGAAGSGHIARLWANGRVLALMRDDPAANRAKATELATRYRLVTPVSGAVVLETKEQYDQSRLKPAERSSVPTIPEPGEWLLLILVFMALLAMAWGRRPRIAPS